MLFWKVTNPHIYTVSITRAGAFKVAIIQREGSEIQDNEDGPNLVAAIPFGQWPAVVEELKRVTAVGGWIELGEMGETFHNAGPATKQMVTWWTAIAASRGIDASKMAQIGALLKQAGLCNVKVETRTLAVGSWGGRLGHLLAQNLLAGWPALRPLAQSMLGVSPELFNAVMSRLAEEWNAYRTTYEVYFACGQVGEVTYE